MKISSIDLFARGSFATHAEFQTILQELRLGILSIVWHSPNKFIIKPVKKANGVNPIKTSFIITLAKYGWETEQSLSIIKGVKAGPIDAIKRTSQGIFAVERDTGNISSSHRALNKIALLYSRNKLLADYLLCQLED